MVARPGESRLTPRLFLVAPAAHEPHLAACLKAACEAGDVASLLTLHADLIPIAQGLGVAALTPEPNSKADGIHVDAAGVAAARLAMGTDAIVGGFAAASRHFAMEAAEAGADYVALSQKGASLGGEPIVKWCAEFLEIPCVAFDPASVSDLDILLPQKPDFIRPLDAMWDDPESARRIITELMQRLTA